MNPENPYQPQQPSQVPQQQPAPGQYAMPGTPPQPMQQPGYSAMPPRRGSSGGAKWVVLTVVFILTTLAASGVAVWAYMNYLDQKKNVDSKVSVAVATAVKEQADKDAADFLEKEKQPNRQFVGPDDYGRLAFDYPKTWSVYTAKDVTAGSGTYEAYFNPGVVPVVSQKQQFALRVTIEDKDYDRVVDGYANLVKRGDLKSSSVKADEQNGTRLDGTFTKDIKGFAVIFKIRDKTVTMRSDAQTFKKDFDALIKTITFNK